MTAKSIRVLCIGDLVGRPGRGAVTSLAARLVEERKVDLLIVNAENAAGGVGLDPESARELRNSGVDVITLGDHTWQVREIKAFLEDQKDHCIRPANYPEGAPGRGWTIATTKSGVNVGVMNIIGRVFMTAQVDCPFRAADRILSSELKECKLIICDFHAEATSEKMALGRYLDGRVSLIVGTHTHVQTADEQILPLGTGYISDLGMTGVQSGVIGMDSEVALQRFLTAMPHAYKLAKGYSVLCGLLAEIDCVSGCTLKLERIRITDSA